MSGIGVVLGWVVLVVRLRFRVRLDGCRRSACAALPFEPYVVVVFLFVVCRFLLVLVSVC